jgi:hypothetical protein
MWRPWRAAWRMAARCSGGRGGARPASPAGGARSGPGGTVPGSAAGREREEEEERVE